MILFYIIKKSHFINYDLRNKKLIKPNEGIESQFNYTFVKYLHSLHFAPNIKIC